MDLFQAFFMHYGGLAGALILILGALFFFFVKKSIGSIICLIGIAFLMFYYVF
jgi:hypothetical protein